jgi:hypothetical protein
MKHAKASLTLPAWSKSVARLSKCLGLAVLAWAGMASQAQAQTYAVSNIWTQIAAATPVTNNIDTANDTRGMCYFAPSNMVIIPNHSTHVIETYDGTAGTSNGVVNNSGIASGNFTLSKVGVGTDGILYGANLQTAVTGSSAPYKLYSWTNLSVAPSNCYATTSSDAIGQFIATNGSITSFRIGDTFAITGGGANTMILAGVNGKNYFILLSTTDGVNFTPTILTVPTGLPTPGSGVQFGLAFYTNNTFLVNPNASGGSGELYLVQFPTNFASLTSPVTATVLATVSGVSGDWLDLSYNAAAGLLATHPNATSAANTITLYSLPSTNFAGLASLAATNLSFTTSQSINGNETGEIALGGAGRTNAIYTLDTSAGLQATAILFTAAPIAPSISTEPAGGTVFTNIGMFSFSVAATGTLPLAYQWQYNTVSNQATASNIPGATNASYALSPVSVTNTGWYDVVITNKGGVTSSIPVLLTVSAPVSSFDVSNLWNIAPGTVGYPYLDSTTYDTRGLAYDTNTMTVLVADKGADVGIYVLDANTGTNMFALNTVGVGITGDQFPLGQVGVGDDGVVYACNVYDTGSQLDTFVIYSWSSVSTNASPNYAYGPGDPSGAEGEDRWGDTMAVRGAGTNTQILFGTYYGYLSGPATNAALFTTSDGVSFSPTLLIVTNATIPAGFSTLGIAFGAGNTFWTKSPGYNLRQIAFDPVSGNCSLLQDISTATNGAAAFSSMSAICLDVQNNLLAGITFNDVPNDLSLFVLGTTTNTLPYMFDQAFFPSFNGNSQDNGATAVKYPRIYSLDVNNGIVALTYSVPLVPFSVISVSDTTATGVVLAWQSVAGHTYQVQFATALAGAPWTNVGAPIVATGATTTYADTSAEASLVTGFYRVAGK